MASSNQSSPPSLGHDEVQVAKQSILNALGHDPKPRIGIILGSGLGQLAQRVQARTTLPYARIEHMPTPSVVGHGGEAIFGQLGGASVMCLSGRVHLYEGHEPDRVTFGVRLLAALGVQTLIVTNAAGGIGKDCGPGRLMLITDHINLTGKNPLVGPNDDRFGTRFVDMSDTYPDALQQVARRSAQQLSLPLVEGVYVGVLGPSYETPAEVRMFHQWGASAVGMSTVHEVIVARHLGLGIIGLSCITNHAAGYSTGALNHEDVKTEAQKSSAAFCQLVETICSQLPGP